MLLQRLVLGKFYAIKVHQFSSEEKKKTIENKFQLLCLKCHDASIKKSSLHLQYNNHQVQCLQWIFH